MQYIYENMLCLHSNNYNNCNYLQHIVYEDLNIILQN